MHFTEKCKMLKCKKIKQCNQFLCCHYNSSSDFEKKSETELIKNPSYTIIIIVILPKNLTENFIHKFFS